MAAGTTLSRLTGLVRTGALAAVLGVTALSDAYNTANTLPTMLFMLVSGGSLSTALVPLLARCEKDERAARAGAVGWAVVLVTVATTVVVIVASPLIVRLLTQARATAPDYDAFVRVTAQWLALFAPQITLYGVSVFAVAVLTAEGRLGAAGLAPVLTNLVTIGAVVAYAALGGPQPPDVTRLGRVPLVALGLGTTIGVGAMAAAQYAAARRAVSGLRLRRRPHDAILTDLLRLARWTAVYVVANQIGLAVVVAVANGVNGGVTAYQWAFTLMQLPYAIVGVSILSALFPRLSRAGKAPRREFKATFVAGAGATFALMVPAAVGLALLAAPVTGALLAYGAVEHSGAELIAVALQAFALALLPFTAFQLLTRAAYALDDMRTPALVNVAVNAVNAVGALLAAKLSTQAMDLLTGLVGAYGVSYVFGSVLLAWTLSRRHGALGVPWRSLRSAAIGSTVMAPVVLAGASWTGRAEGLTAALRLTVLVAAGAALYVAAAWASRSPEVAAVVGARGQRAR